MENSLLHNVYNPDVLSCIANLSNDEVFTPPELANKIIDLLPQELFENPDTKFLDPCCKSGVFLREIAKRLIKGLERQIPDLEKRIEHIFSKQLFGIAITELTSLLSRRSVYCSKYPSSPFSAYQFPENKPQGNIIYQRINHTWKDGKCIYCGASQSEYDRKQELESYAYQFIHNLDIEKVFKMKFDVIIGNPPYQLNDGGNGSSAKPIYHLFIENAKKLNPRYLVMIIPARWYAGGKGLDEFRTTMLNDRHIKTIIDFPNPKECFPGLNISGGVCYFLRDNNYSGDCTFSNIIGNRTIVSSRKLNEFEMFVRYNEALSIIHKIKDNSNAFLSSIITSRKPFGIDSYVRGEKEKIPNALILHSSEGIGYIPKDYVTQGIELIDKYKVIIGKALSGHIGETDENGQVKVLARIDLLSPNEICTESYLCVGRFENKKEAFNLETYLKTKFSRFLLLQALTSMNITKDKFCFVPLQDFSKAWTDQELYQKYNLTQEEINFIESMIRPME